VGEPEVPRAPLWVRVAMKPIPSLRAGLASIDFESGEEVRATYQRSDVTSVPAASVVAEHVVAFEIARAFLEKFGGDSIPETRRNFEGYVKTVGPRKIYQ
jgi:chorismate synthase